MSEEPYTPTTDDVRANFGWNYRHDEPSVEFEEAFDRWLAAEIVKAQAEQREKDAQIVERFVDHYPEDIFTPEGTTMDAHSARVIRLMAPVVAAAIREEEKP